MTDRRTALLDAAVQAIARRGVRGLRVEEVAAEAGVSVALVYYHFTNRAGLLAAALQHVSDRAGRYVAAAMPEHASALERLQARLLGEIQDVTEVRDNSIGWGELRWAAVFEPELRPVVAGLTLYWVDEIADEITAFARQEGLSPPTSAHDIAERLIALVEGLSGRWLTGAMPPDRVRALLAEGIRVELGIL
ncbi:MAG: TetR/AcrR family transcriptional regulator [Streptosporangiaceae bacterium]